jgi:hypothetical protein
MAWEKLGTASVTGSVANTSWKELARGTGSGGTTIDTGTFTAKDNIMVLGHITQGRVYLTYNNSTGNEYAHRRSEEGGTDSTQTSQDKLDMSRNLGEDVFFVGDSMNITNQEKLGIYNTCSQNSAGAGNAPKRQEWITKYVPSSLATNITSVKITTDSGTYDSNDQIVVLGYDNDEADSGTNFWQELASVTRTDSGSTIDSGNFAAKKYLMVEFCSIPADSGFKGRWELGHSNGTYDTSSNYAQRWQDNGGSDSTGTSEATFYGYTNDDDAIQHGRAFIINNASTEKLVMVECSSGGSTTGAGNAPSRREVVAKWANTSNQITNIRLNNQVSGGNAASGSFIKVYGAD